MDNDDVVYKNERGKFRAVVDEIVDCHKRGQPVLVGTVSVEKSEVVASLLRKKQIPHNVLNAKQHEKEAHVVAQAGRKGAVTISTNMAGRGTDIILGGNAEFMARAEIDPGERRQAGARVAPGAGGGVPAGVRAVQDPVRRREAGGAGGGRAAHPRHRAPRIAAHRQSAARPFGPAGRSGQLALLPVAGRRPDAHLRRRAHHRPDGAPGDGRGRADRARPHQPRDRERPEEGRRATTSTSARTCSSTTTS